MTEEKASPRGRLIPVVAICALILAIAALYILFRPEPTGETPFLRPRPATSTLPATTTSAPPAGTAQTAVPDPLEAAVAQAVRDADLKIGKAGPGALSDGTKRMQAIKDAFWRREDEVMAAAPKYSDGKDQYRKKAEALLAGINGTDPKAVQALSDVELAVFWEKGGLVNPDGYEHAYLARAILEIACEQSPEDFQLLCVLKDAMSTAMPTNWADYTPIAENIDELWAVTQRQKTLIEKGAVPPSIDTMAAMDDWLVLATLYKKLDRASVKPACQWLVDNADAGGWSVLKQRFAVGLDDSRPITACFFPLLYSYPVSGTNLESDIITQATSLRSLPSFKGSPKFRAAALPGWEYWKGQLKN